MHTKMCLNAQADRSREKGKHAGRRAAEASASKFAPVLCCHVGSWWKENRLWWLGQGSDGMTQRAAEAAPHLTVFLYGGTAVGRRLLAAVPLHFYSCHWGTAAGVSAILIFHIHPGSRYQIKPSKEDHRERRIPTLKVPRIRGVLLYFGFFVLFCFYRR